MTRKPFLLTTTRIGAFILMHVVTWMTLTAAVTTTAVYTIARSLRIQERVSTWSNDDAVVHAVLRRLRHDIADTGNARIDGAADGADLVLRQTGRTVRYRNVGRTVERIEQPDEGRAVTHTWLPARASLRWSIEDAANGKLVWVRVQMTDSVHHDDAPKRDRYATAIRVGGAAVQEARP